MIGLSHCGEEPRSLLKNFRVIVPIVLVHSAIYRQVTYSSLRTPWLLEPTWLDRRIPFMLWTVWPYLGLVILCMAPLFVRSQRVFRMTMLAYLFAAGTALSFYLFLPTSIERVHFERVPENLSWMIYHQFVHSLGTGACFPSGHIIFPMIGCWSLYRDQRTGRFAICLFAALASPSILTIKEHVAWDWLGGVVVGGLAILMAERFRSAAPPIADTESA